MKHTYKDFIEQTFEFPQEGFEYDEQQLLFNDIPVGDLIKQFGTPLRLTYLPKISENIRKANMFFNMAIAKNNYQGTYNYCYCTKSSHFSFVLEEALKNNIHIETSSAFDVNIVQRLYKKEQINKETFVICNGFKREQYINNIAQLIDEDFVNTIPILDHKTELKELLEVTSKEFKVGIRIAAEEGPKFEFYTSRLGIGYQDILPFYEKEIANNNQVELEMLHFFINTGINDSAYYWDELRKSVKVYIELKKVCPNLKSLNIGGGFPSKNSLGFEYDYEYMANEIITQIKQMCYEAGVIEPNIFTEFGSYTVGESGAMIYTILGEKKQNDRESWYMINGSFMTQLPDTWALSRKFIMLAINNWNKSFKNVLLGGLTCDSEDYYSSEAHSHSIYLPEIEEKETLHIGFFNTGAYQEVIGGYGGLQHCLIPAAKHIVVNKNEQNELTYTVFKEEQNAESMLNILGY